MTKFILELEWPGAQRLLTILGHPTIPSSSSVFGENNPQVAVPNKPLDFLKVNHEVLI